MTDSRPPSVRDTALAGLLTDSTSEEDSCLL
jgi:hypothetical protein